MEHVGHRGVPRRADGVALERVAIVGMRRLAKSCLAGAAELAGFPAVPIGDDGTAGVPGALRMQTWLHQ